ncbi:hypothetical protein FRZ67_14985 [Panacibacter ginsenosidivorans]|uniref:Cytochrome c domain-containing protein n=1 Tax=Panacibacter ginsenosidivorans TaxID=1813871 RepID=A0A5B8VD19_9BACT|nr:c-type cytochrome domain-containing protein [Panacibacter ginsenosidivorans]QEC68546.1 hypothetical protein FRZ67_14985 [Panacibacter ginsenosidivorans]
MKKMFLLFIITAGLLFACKHQVIGPQDNGNGGITDTTGNNDGGSDTSSVICFEAEVLPIFQSSCAKSGCHDPSSKAEGYVLNSYQNIMKRGIKAGNPDGSKIYQVIVNGEMPPAGEPNLTIDQVATIKQWILEGANNTTGCSGCDTSIYTYSGAVNGIMQNNCVACHSASLKNGGVDLSTYNGVKSAAVAGKLMGTITHSTGYVAMPQGAAKLGDCEIKQIQKWIDSGTPNN